MKNYLYLLLFILGGTLFTSCVEDEAPEDAYGQGPNVVAFFDKSVNFVGVANGSEYPNEIALHIKGPNMDALNGQTVTATISMDQASLPEAARAVEGTHFTLGTTTLTFTPENDYIAVLPITMLSAGINAPLATDPILRLKVENVTGAPGVIAGGNHIDVNLLYLCDSQLQGAYVATTVRDDGATVVNNNEVLVRTGEGEYRGQAVGAWAPGAIGGEPGFTFQDVCDKITVPEQNLVNLYSNLVYGTPGTESTRDPATGIITIKYTVTFAAGDRTYTATYVPK